MGAEGPALNKNSGASPYLAGQASPRKYLEENQRKFSLILLETEYKQTF